MAAYTSTQTGNFSAASTWGGGGAPSSDGDTFNITNGHTVTVDSGITTPTNGFGDSYIYGVLKLASSANTPPILRMDGRLYINTNGLLWCQDGAHIQITGTSGEAHGIWQENQDAASVIMEGSDGMPYTTLSSNTNENATSFAVASASNFAVGEWVGIYHFNGTQNTSSTTTMRDEGFWIHDIDGNTIYVREFVGPEDVTVTSYSGSDIVVSNAKKFEKGKYIVFGTGSNRNAKQISSINYASNKITCNSSITGNPTGATVYHSGSEKYHGSGEKVRKMATINTAEVASSSTTITLANANMFAQGDEIFIEKRSEADGTLDYEHADADDYHHTISSVNGNTLTLSSAIGYKVVAGSIITRLSRKILIEATTPNTDYAYFYCEYYNANYNKKLVLKDVYFKNFGSDNNNVYQGVVIRGYLSTNSLPVTTTQTIPSMDQGCWVEGIVCMNADNHERDYGNIWFYTARYCKMLASVSLYGNDGFTACWYQAGNKAYNMICAGPESFIGRHEGFSERWEAAYHYYSRGTRGVRVVVNTEEGNGFHHVIIDSAQYGYEAVHCDFVPRRWKMTGLRYGLLTDGAGSPSMIDSSVRGLSGLSGGIDVYQAGGYFHNQHYRGLGRSGPIKIVKNDFEYDAIKMFGYLFTATWDNTENAWLFKRYVDSDNAPVMEELVYLPAGTTMRVTAKVKLVSGFSGTYPYLGVIATTASVDDNSTGNAANDSTIFSVARVNPQYTSAAASAYEEKQITVGPFDFPFMMKAGVFSNNRTASEGYYIKDFRVYLDPPYANPRFAIINDGYINPYRNGLSFKNNFNDGKVRLGGRLA